MTVITLFDIDKTLINRSTAHLSAFFFALDAVYGVKAAPNIISPHGMTDQQIIREVLKVKGVVPAAVEEGLAKCMAVMVDKFKELNATDTVSLLPGVVELLTALTKRSARIGLVTGNLEQIAWAKLEKAGIARFFAFGGFGSDHEDRGIMAALALSRCDTLYGTDTGGRRVTLFGDTPYDMAAARAVGARAVGVATGYPTGQELAAAGADIVLDDLSDTKRVLGVVFDS
jgi:phosphoglycolate phosphatase